MTRDLSPKIAVHVTRITESLKKRELSRTIKIYATVKVMLILVAVYVAVFEPQ